MVRGMNLPDGPKGARIYPRKRLGQHFLKDKFIIGRIVEAAGIRAGEHVLEIGPGTGTLTRALLDAGARVTAVEIDARLSERLEGIFKGVDAFSLVRGDALKLSFARLLSESGAESGAGAGGPATFKVVSNLPYNISGPVLFKFIEEREAFTTLILMLQKEVAVRICTGPGSKAYGILSVLLGVYYDIKREFDVSRTSFSPPPKVDSTVLSLRKLDVPRVEVCDYAFFTAVVKAAFGTRRKMLQNSLKSLGLGKEVVLEALLSASIDPKRRAETLSLAEFGSLASALYGDGPARR
jgi:16S rRNA (adenine1518-N6/adenine1519-N6)-dimethyltransferase